MTTAESIEQFLREAKPGARLRVAERLYIRKGTNGRCTSTWTFQFYWRGAVTEVGLGPVAAMSPEIAKVIAARCQAQVKAGYWPGTGPGPRATREIRQEEPTACLPPSGG